MTSPELHNYEVRAEDPIRYIMGNFAFRKVHDWMKKLGYDWMPEGLPSVDTLMEVAEGMLTDVMKSDEKDAVIWVWGLRAEKSNGVLSLAFTPEQVSGQISKPPRKSAHR